MAKRKWRGRETGAEHPGAGIVVEISDTQGGLAVDRCELAALAARVLHAEGVRRATISVALVDNASIHRLNLKHLHHDWPTDVISFVLSEPDEPELAGEVIVSAEMAAATASESAADARAELSLYMIHGLLHLCGYDDRRDEDTKLMREREAEALAREGLVNTFPLVGRIEPVA
jgi:probable rRNA maturation factor